MHLSRLNRCPFVDGLDHVRHRPATTSGRNSRSALQPNVDLTNCHALQFECLREDGSEGSLIVWRDGLRGIKPIERGKRLSELRPDDPALAFDRPVTLTAVIVYR